MSRRAALQLLGLTAAVGAAPLAVWLGRRGPRPDEPAPSQDPALLAWAELIPPGWTPPRHASDALYALRDDDPEARAALRALKQAQRQAPLRTELHQREVSLQGYVVPLELAWQGLDEFLLVPYFGACIHSPPPPPNQIVRVLLRKPLAGLRAMDVVRVRGRLLVQRQPAGEFSSGYLLQADHAERQELGD